MIESEQVEELEFVAAELAFRIKALRAGLNDALTILEGQALDKNYLKSLINKSLAFDAALAAAAGDERP